MTDRELLQRYADGGDQEAFAQLVTRHMGLVYGSARRQVGTGAGGAEDITQAVFLLLAQRAKSLRREGSLAGWLFQATGYCCRNFRRQELIRQKHEREAAVREEQSAESGESAGRAVEIAEFLDAGLAGLHAGERGAVLLRYLEGRSFEEMAGELGISVEAAKKRATRGLGQLRDYFARRGHGVAGESLAGFMTAGAALTPPAGLVASVSGIAKGGAAGAHVHGLATGAAKLMAWAKLKIAALAVVGIVTGAAVATALAVAAETGSRSSTPVAASAPVVAATTEARALTLEPLAAVPTQQQMLQLMAASRARYRAVDLEYEMKEIDTNSTATGDEVWRWTGENEFFHANIAAREDGVVNNIDQTVWSGPTWSKQFEKTSENGPDGIVMRGDQLMRNTDSNPFKLMELRFAQNDAPMVWDEKTGFLSAESRLTHGTRTGQDSFWAAKDDAVEKFIIDPSRGFVPIHYQRSKVDGTALETDDFEDYREVEKGFWIPWKITSTWDKTNRHEYAVKRVRINGEIPVNQLNFEFPPETQISNRIVDQIYTPGMEGVPEIARALATTQPGGGIKPGDGGIPPAAAAGAENISGEVGKISVMPDQLNMGRIAAGETTAQVLVVEPLGVKDPKDVKIVPSVDWVKVTLDEKRTSIEQLRGAPAYLRNPDLHMTEAQIAALVAPKWRLRYLVTATPPASYGLARITSVADLPYVEIQAGPKDKWVRVPVVGELLPPVAVVPATLLVESGKTEYRVSVKSNGPGSWKFKGATGKGEGLNITSVVPDANGRELVITVAQTGSGFVSGTEQLEFEGVSKPVEIRLVGLVNK